MNRKDIEEEFIKKFGINPINSQGEPDIDYVKYLEYKIINLSAPEEPEEEIMTANEFFNKLMECDSYSIDRVDLRVKGGSMWLTGFTMQTENKPQGEIIEGVRPEVLWFASIMEEKLKENDHKGGWGDCEITWLIQRIKDEISELESGLLRSDIDKTKLIRECADISNFAMMVADNINKLNS